MACDHGRLGEYALRSGRFKTVFFVDRLPHVLESIRQRDAAARCLAIPAEAIRLPILGTFVLLGVGAHTILNVLSALGAAGSLRAERLILSPQRDAALLEARGVAGYQMIRALDVDERGRGRRIFVFDREAPNE